MSLADLRKPSTARRGSTDTLELKSGIKMNKCVFTCLTALSALVASADEQIDRAIDDVMRFSCLTNYATAHSVPEWGCPAGVSFACGMTNDVRRRVFITALAECGTAAYRDAIVRWFGGVVPASVSARTVERLVAPATTRMEGYAVEHFDDPGISNVWLNVKALFLAEGNVEEANDLDTILNGEAKAEREVIKGFEKARLSANEGRSPLHPSPCLEHVANRGVDGAKGFVLCGEFQSSGCGVGDVAGADPLRPRPSLFRRRHQ